MAPGQGSLDCRLALMQPVERGIELILVDLAKAERFAQAGGGGGRRKHARRRHLGDRIEDAPDQQRDDEVAAAVALGAEQTVEADLTGGAEGSGDMAMGEAAGDGEGIAFGGDDRATFEHTAQAFDMGCGPVGEVAQRAFAHLAALAVALAQQDGGGRVPVRDGFDIHGRSRIDLAARYKSQMRYYMATVPRGVSQKPPDLHQFIVITRRKLGLTGPAASRRNPGNCARRPASLACGRARVGARTPMSCSPRSTTGSPRASTPRICRTRRRCSPSSDRYGTRAV